MPANTVIVIAPPARREIIRQILLAHPQLELVGELAIATSLHLIAQLAPDIVILDCVTPQINPLVALPQLRAHIPGLQIITLSVSNTTGERSLLRALGATAYATLEQPGSLAEALTAVGADRRLTSPARPATQPRISGTADLARRHSRHAH
jgi:DNA-binding NarL/FixJ family response regulator